MFRIATMPLIGRVAAALIVSLVGAYAESKPGSPDLFEGRVHKGEDGRTLPYRLLKPENYDAQKDYPLVLFLHGAGERGSDNVSQLKHCVGLFAEAENRTRFPCFVVVPQCPEQREGEPWGWTGVHPRQRLVSRDDKLGDPARMALEIVDLLQKEFSIDSGRLYLGGLSMGGFATWDIVARHPLKFAAAIPICGGGDPAAIAPAAKLPIWAFHGADDPVVPVAFTESMIDAVRKAGGDPKYTAYARVGHDSWVRAFSEPDLLPWLFAQKR